MHSNMEPGRAGESAFGRKIPSTAIGSTEPELADALTSTRERAGYSGYAEKDGTDGRRLSPEREAQIRQRIEDGIYNSPSMVDELARRIIRSADL